MGKRTLLLLSIITLVVFFESSIPYYYAGKKCRAENVFLGQVIFAPDQNMYFSFIRQAKDGQFILNNKLTYIPNKPVFINLEYWLIGTIQRATGISENAIYHVWRFLGILLLVVGFYLLARMALPAGKVVTALIVFMFTGGFGFLFAILNAAHLISLDTAHAGMFDMRYGFLPFMQAITNPHFSLPHGLILIAYACYLRAGTMGKTSLYAGSGLLFCIIGLVRPYDIMPPFIIFPLYILMTGWRQKVNIKTLLQQLLPLLLVLPVLLYNVWLFRYHEIFKYWSLQGHNAGSLPPLALHYLAYGIVGLLTLLRVLQYKTNPLSRIERFMVLWFVVSFVFMRLGLYLPIIGWSPQIGVYLAVPLTILALSLRYPAMPKLYARVALTLVALTILISNLGILFYYTKNFSGNENSYLFYAGRYEMAAWQWLNNNTDQGEVVLATPFTSQRIAKYTSASVAAAHYSVTPMYAQTTTLVATLFSDSLLTTKQLSLLHRLNARYVYIGQYEKVRANIKALPSEAIKLVYENPEVSIYKVE